MTEDTSAPPNPKWSTGGLVKRLLYYAPTKAHLDDFLSLAQCLPGSRVGSGGGLPTVSYQDVQLRISAVFDADSALDLVNRGYFNLLVVDLRDMAGGPNELERNLQRGFGLLSLLDDQDIERRFKFHRIVALLSGTDGFRVDHAIASMGSRGVRNVLRQDREAMDPEGTAREGFAKRCFDEMLTTLLDHRPGSTALCAAGGGITGIYFELGALKCLADCLGGMALSDLDMYFGISGGAVITGMMANGYSVDELMASIAGVPGGRIPPLSMSLFRLSHLNLTDMARRLRLALGQVARAASDVLLRRSGISRVQFLPDFHDWIGPPLRTDAFEQILRARFCREGTTNDFRRLPSRLYIGATDQDTRSHVLFGNEGLDNVPISRAIQASMSVNPAFCSTELGGRYYTDGAVTRTSNFIEAIRKGANLIFLVDPFVPYVSKEPGYARDRGLLYHVDQDIRALSYTRFENARNVVLRRHPEVSLYSFLPANNLRRLLSINPMDHRPYLEIWQGAYRSTLRRIMRLRHKMRGDLAVRGISFDTSRAEEVARRLRFAEEKVTFSDFFPDGRVDLQLPALSLERPERRPVSATLHPATHAA